VNECLHQRQPIDRITEKEGGKETHASAEAQAPPEAPPEPEPDGEKKQERGIPGDMLLREAEVIAQNLKESGTRR
jgi:hypothetical protein